MKRKHGALIVLVFLATCSEESHDPAPASIESAQAALGVSPASEIATWQRVSASNLPDGRYLQAIAYDESRKVVVMFGGQVFNPSTGGSSPTNDTWDWSPVSGKWALHAGSGTAPEPRSGAAMVFDSGRNKLVLFGGRAGSGYNLEDTWELDAATGAWMNVSTAGNHPSARSQAGMVFEKSTGKIFLFGGGRSDPYSYDGTGITASMGDAWELDPTTYAWSPVSMVGGPTARHDFGVAWDSGRNKVVLFGGMQKDDASVSGVPKQDTWEYDPATPGWSERTMPGSKPSARYAHGMAFDGGRGRAVVFGGWDISTGAFMNDLWDWDPTTGAWTQRLGNGNTTGPTGRLYASAVYDAARARLEIIAGGNYDSVYGKGYPGIYGFVGSRDVWELDPATVTFTNRTVPLDVPSARSNHCLAYYPPTGKTYMFGGYQNSMFSTTLDDLWAWDGTTWAQVDSPVRPPARADAAMAYDPARKALILFGGTSYYGTPVYNDTWEWTSSGGWKQLTPVTSPDALYSHGLVTDNVRGKILLFGGYSPYYWFYGPDGGVAGAPFKDPVRNEVWEWDGAKLTWTNRTPTALTATPSARQYPTMAFDDARQKLFLFDGMTYNWNTGGSSSSFWEWDAITAGWTLRDSRDWLSSTYNLYAVYDSIRRREVIFTDSYNSVGMPNETWELDPRGPTWYVRTPAGSPGPRYSAAMAFDSTRDVVVLFGGISNSTNTWTNETWEYKVTGWGNGEGCTVAFASACASGQCVDGVCCDASACSGPCKSCNVAGAEGTCTAVKAGTEVAGSCSSGQACDGKGNCMSSNGQPCTSASGCASGYCADGVCCDAACTGACVACNLAGRVGQCTPYTAGTDPQGECGKGTGLCRSTCDGVGACVFPGSNQPCSSCTVCDGVGTCSTFDPYCRFAGAGGNSGGTGGIIIDGGAGGIVTNTGGITSARGGAGGTLITTGGAGGTVTARGGAGGVITSTGGITGTSTGRGGAIGTGGISTTSIGTGGIVTSGGGSTGTTARGGAGGTGGLATGIGGAGGQSQTGSTGKPDGSAGKGGSLGNPDGGDLVSIARLHRSGCSCTLAAPRRANLPVWGLALLALGPGLRRRRIRRR